MARANVMPTYRLYSFKDGHIHTMPRPIEAQNDADAIKQAKQFLDGADLELWCTDRRVITLKSRDGSISQGPP
jgi:hypothetical protein